MRFIRTNKIYLILALAFIFRVISVNQSFWLDEATTATVARDLSYSDYLAFATADFHPPIYYLLVKFWAQIFGISELGIRSLSIFAGVGTVYLLYLIGKELFDKKTAYLTSILLATSGLHIYFSQEARMYSLASFFVALSVLFFVRLQPERSLASAKFKKGTGVGRWLGFAVAISLMTLTHYLTVFMIPIFWIYGIGNSKNWWKKFITSHNILAFSWLLWLPTFLKQLGGGLGVSTTSPLWWNLLGKTSIKEILLVPAKFMLGRISIDNNLIFGVVTTFVGVLFAFPVREALRKKGKAKLVLLWLFVPFFLSAILGIFIPVFSYFRLLYILPAFYFLVSIGLSKLSRKVFRLTFFLLVFVNVFSSFIYLFDPKFQREDWKGLVQSINDSSVNNSIVVFPANSQMEAYRFYDSSGKISGPEGLSENYQEIWLMRYVQEIFDPSDLVRLEMEKLGYDKKSEHNFNGVVVWRYQK